MTAPFTLYQRIAGTFWGKRFTGTVVSTASYADGHMAGTITVDLPIADAIGRLHHLIHIEDLSTCEPICLCSHPVADHGKQLTDALGNYTEGVNCQLCGCSQPIASTPSLQTLYDDAKAFMADLDRPSYAALSFAEYVATTPAEQGSDVSFFTSYDHWQLHLAEMPF